MTDTISLSGLWDFVVDLDPKYHRSRNYARPEWDRRHWQKVPVPGVWNRYAERYDIFEGVGWFAREFVAPDLGEGSTCLLRFGGVNYLCEVFVNGQPVGGHEGGYTEFVLDVSDVVHPGHNHVAVRVDNRSLHMKLPPVLGYFNYGGIHRDVTLEIYDDAYLDDLAVVATPVANGGRLVISGIVAGRSAGAYEVEVRCAASAGRAEASAGQRFSLSVEVPDARPWSPDHPALYPLRIALTQGERTCGIQDLEVGFRQIEADGARVLLNGDPVDLRGICYLYDSPAYGLVVRPEQYEADLALLRELNVNAIRSHFPFPHSLLSACDRAGLIVWVEIPVYCIDTRLESCRSAFTDPAWRQLALTMVEEMIRMSRLHPSVCIYGIGNECQLDAPGTEAFFRSLSDRARELDSTRLISYACLYGLAGNIAEAVDVVGFNEYWGWYDILPDTARPAGEGAECVARSVDLQKLVDLLGRQAANYRKPVLLTEFGADSVPGYRSGSRELWSEDYHAQVLAETLALAGQYAFVCGTFPFGFSDYRDPSKEINAYWDEMNYKGVVDYWRRKKRPFVVLQDAYARRQARESHIDDA
jgi:beta-glucuronidase